MFKKVLNFKSKSIIFALMISDIICKVTDAANEQPETKKSV